jgi:beta-lactamase regulating signal transducer with metallopeptidase domain
MTPLFFYACVFSLLAFIAIGLIDRFNAVSSHNLTRFSLLLLLCMPFFLLLPEWYVLPSSHYISPVQEAVNQSSPPWILWLWLSGMVLCIVRVASSLLQLHWWQKNSHVIDDAELQQLVENCKIKQHVTGNIILRELHHQAGPVASGIFSRLIYFPPNWRKWNQQTLSAVILHEIGHHSHRDPLWRLISLITRSIHWYNPLVFWLSKKLHGQSEMACDARVINSGFRKDAYAHILCDLAAHAPHSAMAMASPSGLEIRVRELGVVHRPLPRWIFITAMIVLLLGALAFSILRPANDPGSSMEPTLEDVELRKQADPFPADR